MSLTGEQVLLRVYLDSADRVPYTPTYELIVKAARNGGMAGATVLKGILGFGSRGLLRHSPWALVDHVPVIVEIVDTPHRIGTLVRDTLATLMNHGIATLERAHVMMYRPGQTAAPLTLRLGPAMRPLSTLPALEVRKPMQIQENGILLRVFIGESDKHLGLPLYEAIVQKAREAGLAGATVLRGVEGFGANSVVHKVAILEMSTNLPIIVEIADTEETIRHFLPSLEQMVREGMITMEYVAIVRYHRRPPADSQQTPAT